MTSNVEAFSFSSSGSGYLQPNHAWYYYYIYQYAYIWNGQVVSESHIFSFSGALSGEENAELLGLSDNWLIYEGEKYFLAIPAISGEKIYIKIKDALDSPGETNWQPISEPVK